MSWPTCPDENTNHVEPAIAEKAREPKAALLITEARFGGRDVQVTAGIYGADVPWTAYGKRLDPPGTARCFRKLAGKAGT